MFELISRAFLIRNLFRFAAKDRQNAEVFGFQNSVAGTIGSFATSDKIRNANSLAFVGGIPIYERYFLGSEYDFRGYNTRSIGPIAPFDSFITTRNVAVATNVSGTPTPITGLDQRTAR